MTASTEVIREYLTKIGYVTDAVSQKRTEAGLMGMNKKVLAVGSAVAGLVASVGAATAAFAYSMRKMYYQSELSNNSVKNIKGVSYALETAGIDADRFNGIVSEMAQSLRYKPGYQQFIESLGVKVKGRETTDVLMDIIKTIKKMPKEAQAPTAGFLGIDLETLFMVGKHMDAINAKRREMDKMRMEMGFDPDAAKKTLMDLTQTMDKLEARAKLVGEAFLASMAPAMGKFFTYLDEGFGRFGKIIQGFQEGHGWKTWLEEQKEAFAHPFGKEVPKTKAELKEETRKTKTEAVNRKVAASATVNALADEYGIAKIDLSSPTSGATAKPQARPKPTTDVTKMNVGAASAVFGTGMGAALGSNTTSNTTVVNQNIALNVTGVKDSQELLNRGGEQVKEAFSPWTARNMRGSHP